MKKTSIKKRKNLSDEDSNSFAIILTLINSKEPMHLSEIAKEVKLPRNLVFYYLKKLKDEHIVLEFNDKRYDVQYFLKDKNVSDDIDALIIVISKIIARELLETMDNPNEEELSNAVIANLRTYIQAFELEVS